MGKRFVIEIEQKGGSTTTETNRLYSSYFLVGGDDMTNLWDAEVERAAAAYAAKGAPAPVSTAWEPKRGDRVLVEAEVVDAVDEYGEATIDLCSVKPMYFPRCVVNRSAIVGPAPVREPGPKFSFGQDALYVPAMEKVIVNHFIGFGKYDVYRMGHESFTAHEDDLLTLDEARERLGKK